MSKRYTKESFENLIKNLYPNIEVTSIFTKMNDPISAKCNICGHEWTLKRANSLVKSGCPKCSLVEKGKRRRLTNEEFLKRMKEKSPTIEILGEYITAKVKIPVRCTVCGNTWESTPNSLLNAKDTGCTKCAIIKNHELSRYSNEEFLDLIKINHPNIIVFDKYTNNKGKSRCHCNVCDTDFVTYNSTLIKKDTIPCPVCRAKHIAKVQLKDFDKFKQQLHEIHPNYTLLSEYKGAFKKVTLKCSICGNIWEATADNLLNAKSGCPECVKKGISKGESLIIDILKELNIEYTSEYNITGDFTNRQRIRVDFKVIYNNKTYFIEYNGKQHYTPIEYFGGEEQLEKQKIRDEDLRKYCLKNNIILLEIPYTIKEKSNIKNLIINTIEYGKN